MNKQKITILGILIVLSMNLTACGNVGEQLQDIGNRVKNVYENSYLKAVEIDDFLGRWEDNTYISSSFDFQCKLNEEWEWFDDEMLCLANSISDVNFQSMNNDSVKKALNSGESVSVMYATTADGIRGTFVSIMTKPFSYNLFSAEELLTAGVKVKNDTDKAYTMIDVNFIGEDVSALYIQSDETDNYKHTVAVMLDKGAYYVTFYSFSDKSLSDALSVFDYYSQYIE